MTFLYKGVFQHTRLLVESQTNKLSYSISGPATNSGTIITNQQVGVIGVCLYPHALAIALGVPITELVNQAVNLFDINKPEVATLARQIYESPGNHQRIALLNGFFINSFQSMSLSLIPNRYHIKSTHFDHAWHR